jgi:hypothetical protein
MVIERYREIKKEDEARKTEEGGVEVKTPTGPTLKEILANRENSRLFGELLSEREETELAGNLLRGDLEIGDLRDLEGFRNEFVEILEQSKNLRESLTPENLREMIAHSSNLQEIYNLVGPKGIQEIMSRQLVSLAIRNPEEFKGLREILGRLDEERKNIKVRDKEIKDLCKKYNVSEKELAKALRIEEEDERIKEIKRVVGKRMGIWRIFKWRKVVQKARKLDTREEIETMLENLNRTRAEFGEVLAATISGNEEVKRELISVIKSESPERMRERAFSFKEIAREMLPEEDFEKDILDEWERYKTSKDIRVVSDGDREDFIDQFQKEKMKNKTGFWSDIFKVFFSFLLDGFDRKKLM